MNGERNAVTLQVSMEELSPLMISCLDEGKEVLLTVTGNSMAPFLRHSRDQVVLKKPADQTALQPGEVPLYRRKNGQMVLHRIVERDDGMKRCLYGECEPLQSMHSSSSLTYTMLGDAQTQREPNIHPEQIVAVATAFVRKGKRWDCCGTAYRRRSLRWHKLMPIRMSLVRLWHLLHGVKNRVKAVLKITRR